MKMKRATLFIAFMVFSVTLSAQIQGDFDNGFTIDRSYYNNQLRDLRSQINSELRNGNAPTETRQQFNNAIDQIESNMNNINYGSGTGAVQRQQVQNYNNKISNENQQRMVQYNNPQYYTDRSITNTGTQGISADDRYRQPNNYYSGNIRTQPIHSENLDSKSLQMLREANSDYFSNGNTDLTIDPNATVPLFDAPSLNDKDDDVVYEDGENDEPQIRFAYDKYNNVFTDEKGVTHPVYQDEWGNTYYIMRYFNQEERHYIKIKDNDKNQKAVAPNSDDFGLNDLEKALKKEIKNAKKATKNSQNNQKNNDYYNITNNSQNNQTYKNNYNTTNNGQNNQTNNNNHNTTNNGQNNQTNNNNYNNLNNYFPDCPDCGKKQ